MGPTWKRSARCSSNGCVEVRHDAGRVLLRDSKLLDESPVIEFTPSAWRGFLAAAAEWDRDSEIQVGGVCLDRVGGDYPVCVLSRDPVALHFTWEEWDAFVKGVEAGEFAPEAVAS